MKTSTGFSPRRILCPVDFSELSTLALKYAAVGARAFQAELTILHALHLDVPPYFTSAQSGQLIGQLKQARRAARTELVAHVRRVLDSGFRDIPMSHLIRERQPADAILETMEKEEHDLVVMGTHGRTAASRFLLGSVAENVVRHARIPAFVVRQKQHDFIDGDDPAALPRLERVLCPVESRKGARSTLGQAVSLAEKFKAELTVLRILEPGGKSTASSATRELCSWISPGAADRCAIRSVVRRGRAAEQIVKFATQERQDVIVLGAPTRRRFTSALFGETTELVLRHAPVPVLVLPRPA